MLNTIQALHALYCQLTGLDIRFGMERERPWFEFIKAEFTAEDLRTVVAYIQKGIKEGRRNVGALKFSNLIGDLGRFEEDLAEARKMKAIAARTPRIDPNLAAVQSARGRDLAAEERMRYTARNGGEAAEKALAELKKSV